MDPWIAERVASILDWTPQSLSRIAGGYTPAARYRVQAARKSAFVKIGTNGATASALRKEEAAYRAVGMAFRPTLIGFQDDETHPILVTEDLSGNFVAPPWDAKKIESVLRLVERLHASPAALRPYRDIHGDMDAGWVVVQRDPGPFLGLGIASQAWLCRALPALLAAEASCATSGNAPCHWDIRSDNLAFPADGAKLVDWSEACLSNPRLDLGFWLPSLADEGGPEPEVLLPGAPEVAAWVSGYFAARAGLPVIPHAPRVRQVQRRQLVTALAWAQRALRLPPA
ncbi:phosphotransferase [Gluconacetobacter takamatsuzukensis]|uniref:Phosphotransferase n=1 Tax=Gluconacetobacter takamatsuzukensis TaxID=1286190 RepID=A0A7W4KC98_9PROT|nr:phosphotransferase [Gluconacetobacter takamatsuzukensis]MBB2204273.1 phosphotransferase [Gluconacetobacter takamatsuzukensis]